MRLPLIGFLAASLVLSACGDTAVPRGFEVDFESNAGTLGDAGVEGSSSGNGEVSGPDAGLGAADAAAHALGGGGAGSVFSGAGGADGSGAAGATGEETGYGGSGVGTGGSGDNSGSTGGTNGGSGGGGGAADDLATGSGGSNGGAANNAGNGGTGGNGASGSDGDGEGGERGDDGEGGPNGGTGGSDGGSGDDDGEGGTSSGGSSSDDDDDGEGGASGSTGGTSGAGGGSGDPSSFTLAVIGSSTAAGDGASAFDFAWVGLLDDSLRAAVTTRFFLDNFATGGYGSAHLLPGSGFRGNIDDAIEAEPDLIVVALAGSNDLSSGTTTAQFMARLAVIRDTAFAAGIPVFFVSTAPKDLDLSDREMLELWARNMEGSFGACPIPGAASPYSPCFIDIFHALANPSLGLASELGAGDGIHLNDAGHARIFQVADPILKAYVCSRAACR